MLAAGCKEQLLKKFFKWVLLCGAAHLPLWPDGKPILADPVVLSRLLGDLGAMHVNRRQSWPPDERQHIRTLGINIEDG